MKYPRLIIGILLSCLALMCLAGTITSSIVRNRANDYPYAERITSRGRCGQRFFSIHGRSLKVEAYRCYVTDDSQGLIQNHYISRGYRFLNEGQIDTSMREIGFKITTIERVYTYIDENDRTIIRVYDDTIIRLP